MHFSTCFKVVKDLKGKFGESNSELVGNIVPRSLSEKGRNIARALREKLQNLADDRQVNNILTAFKVKRSYVT